MRKINEKRETEFYENKEIKNKKRKKSKLPTLNYNCKLENSN